MCLKLWVVEERKCYSKIMLERVYLISLGRRVMLGLED